MSDEISYPMRRAFDQWNIASAQRRFLAFFVDSVLTASLIGIALGLLDSNFEWPGPLFFWIVFMWIWEASWLSLTASSPGRKLFGIHIYSPRRDGPPDIVQITLRIMSFWMGLAFLGIGISPLLFRRDRRGWHDTLSETVSLGPCRESPSAFTQQVGQTLIVGQALFGLSLTGALLMDLGIRPEKLNQFTGGSKAPIDLCEAPETFLSQPADALFALSVSPGWADCWNRRQFSLSLLQDSDLFQLAAYATTYLHTWGIDGKEKVANLHNLMNLDEEKTMSRQVASGAKPTSMGVRRQWFRNYMDFYLEFSSILNASQRIEWLRARASDERHSQPVRQALLDRIWVEEFAQGIDPGRAPTSISERWNRDQECYRIALKRGASTQCARHPYTLAIEKIRALDASEMSVEESEHYFSDLDLDEIGQDMQQLLSLWKELKLGHDDQAEKLWKSFPQTSPLYMSFAKKWYHEGVTPRLRE